MPKRNDEVRFLVEYENGEVAHISIDKFTLRNGDAIVRQIAAEWQAGGRIPDGKIKSVSRVY